MVKQDIIWSVREMKESPDDLLKMLDKKELYLPFLAGISTDNRKKEWLSVRVLLKELLGEEKEVCYTESGAPYVSDHSYFLSISHTRGYVAVALNKTAPVGIDLEYISPRVQKIRHRFMSPQEEANLSKNCEDIHLLLHWSAKESMFKALGESQVDFQQMLHIDAFEPVFHTLSTFTAYETKTSNLRKFLIRYGIYSDYLITFTSL